MVSFITELNENVIDGIINENEVVLVDVWGEGCEPCKALSPIIDELSVDYVGKVTVCKLNARTYRDKAIEMGVRNIPTVIVYKNGEIVDRVTGLKPKSEYVEMIDKHI